MTTSSFSTTPVYHYIFTSLILLVSHDCLADGQKPEIKGFNQDKLEIANSLANPKKKSASFKDKVRIGLRLTVFDPITQNSTGPKMKVSRVLRHTLRAKVLTPNHFYIDKFHLQTTPIKWNRINGNYGVRITFYSKFGRNGEVEEELGSLVVKGNLKGKDGLYILHGVGKETFKDKFGKPKLGVVAGYKPFDQKKKLAKSTRVKRSSPQHDFPKPQN